MPRHHHRRKEIRRSARSIRLYLGLFMLLLVLMALGLAFKAGEAVWPAWLVAARTQLIGALLLGLLVTLLLSPVIVEENRNPRPLSGPGHNPEQGPTDRRIP
jgi:uncharacterized BrkB/YihY/UPF0761 family membrane protein